MKNKKLLVAALSISFMLSSQTVQAAEDTNKTEIAEPSTGKASPEPKDNAASQTSDETENTTSEEANQTDKKEDNKEEQKKSDKNTDNKTSETSPEKTPEPVKEESKITAKTLKVKVGEKVDPTSAIENLPEGAKASYEGSEIDTSKPGTQTVDVKITYEDDAKDDQTISVTIEVEADSILKNAKETTDPNTGLDMGDNIVNPPAIL